MPSRSDVDAGLRQHDPVVVAFAPRNRSAIDPVVLHFRDGP